MEYLIYRCFGKSKATQAKILQRQQPIETQLDENKTLSKINTSIQVIEIRLAFLLKKIADTKQEARRLANNGDRHFAMKKLVLAKKCERSRQTALQHWDNLHGILLSLEETGMNKLTINAIKSAHGVLTSKNNVINKQEVEQMLDDILDAKEMSDDISKEIYGAFQMDIDEDELEKELDELNNDTVFESMEKLKLRHKDRPKETKSRTSSELILEEDPPPPDDSNEMEEALAAF